MKKEFIGIWIPEAVLSCADLSATEKFTIAIIDHLDDGRGCRASNGYLAKCVGVSESRLCDILTNLRKHGFLIDRESPDRFARRSSKFSARGYNPCDIDSTTLLKGLEVPANEVPENRNHGSCKQDTDRIVDNIVYTKTPKPQKQEPSKCPPIVFDMRSEWKVRMGGDLPVARLLRALRGILSELPSEAHDDVLQAWKSYLGQTEPKYAGPEAFASKWRTYLTTTRQRAVIAIDEHSD